jgi:hypothetical protein
MDKLLVKEITVMKRLFAAFFALMYLWSYANDGEFYSEGNQLIPINDTTISVQKEILTIDRIPGKEYWDTKYAVTVYYEFFNPGDEKDVIVGFESISAEGYIRNFKVVMNGDSLQHEVKCLQFPRDDDGQFKLYTPRTGYYKDGQFVEDVWGPDDNEEFYFYENLCFNVYHFNAHFKKGVNIIQHTYIFDGAADNMSQYVFQYVLTAANRWANNGIDDFTLILNMGDDQTLYIEKSFFDSASEWTFDGTAEADNEKSSWQEFHLNKGSLVFHKRKFHPDGELFLYSPMKQDD